MKSKQGVFSFLLVISMLINAVGVVTPALAAALPLVDDFEAGLPLGTDPNGIPVGFVTFKDPSSSVAITTTAAPPAPVPGSADPNNVLKMDVTVVSYAGFVHNFENETVNTWVPQDWSAYEGISFWIYGTTAADHVRGCARQPCSAGR